jgi:heavy metal translocating P-type ATPase
MVGHPTGEGCVDDEQRSFESVRLAAGHPAANHLVPARLAAAEDVSAGAAEMTDRTPSWESRADWVLLVTSVALLAGGVVAWMLDATTVEVVCWTAGTLAGVVMSTWWIIQSLRERRFGVDVIALLALIGALLIGEPFAGAVVTVMLATGRLLDSLAAARARRDLSLLVQRAPRRARRVDGARVTEVPVEQVQRGDRLLVAPGEVVPVDGHLVAAAVLDESSLTGESFPVERQAGETVRSGSVNAGDAVGVTATKDAASSSYAQILRLVEQAQASSAPFVRAADRIAVYFVPFTLLLAGLAWLISRDPVRAVAVLVVATPCPLILAAPIAIMSGLSRAARFGVVIKGGMALEQLAQGRILLLDKTGTVTRGKPAVVDIVSADNGPDPDEVLRLAASLDQVSPHVLAESIVGAANARGLALILPTEMKEQHGAGAQGYVEGRSVRLGNADWALEGQTLDWLTVVRQRAAVGSQLTVFVAVDGVPAGVLLLEDPVRPDARRIIRALRSAGVTRTVLLTGDRSDVAETVGHLVGVDSVRAEVDPAGKVATVLAESERGPTIMVGDGINDAPALAAAGVGVALAAGGATASSEAADVVLTVDRIDSLADAIGIARRSSRIAVQAAVVGMGLSLVAMVAAALGLLPPAAGALLQEVIDVLAIGLALRAVLPGRSARRSMPAEEEALTTEMFAEHRTVLALVERIPAVADGLAATAESLAAVRGLSVSLQQELLPHERREESELLPAMEKWVGVPDSTAGLSRAHTEIELHAGRLVRQLAGIDGETLRPSDLPQLRRILYGLYGVLRLHNAEEEEVLFSRLRSEGD